MKAHIVKCKVCGKEFDANREEFEVVGKRYCHKSCYEQYKEQKKQNNMKICFYCKQFVDISDDDYCMATQNRYAHKKCYEEAHQYDKITSDDIYYYLLETVHMKVNYKLYEQQRTKMTTKDGYTNEGILNALKYWYEIKHNSPDKANGGIGIVSYIYNDAQKYYLELARRQKEIAKSLLKTNQEVKTVEVKAKEKRKTKNLIDIDEMLENWEGEE